MSVDVKVAATLSYKFAYGEISSNVVNSEKIRLTFEKRYSEKKMVFIGSEPTRDLTKWQNNLKKNPMPIGYTLMSLSDLFVKYYFKEYSQKDLDNMKILLNNTINLYCKDLNCKPPSNVPVFPKQLTAFFYPIESHMAVMLVNHLKIQLLKLMQQ